MRFPRFVPLYVFLTLSSFRLLAQSPDGNINGLVSDPSSAAVVGAEIVAVNDATGVQYATKTNNDGIYVLPNLPPGPYRLQVSKVGFKTVIKPDIVLNVQDALSINFTLPVGATYEVLTVEGGAPLVNSENASVSTVVDRQFAENLPMNGRSFQTLIGLTPGVVTTAPNPGDGGQFSVNGQRASSNYWMLDGVSANIGMSATPSPGNGLSGALGGFSTLGGTNSLVSVDAMEEFRIQTSTYAPEFGRTPGAQISIITRSGANQFHGTAFDYLRNDLFDANNWFNTAVIPSLPKAEERQNDFGGTLSGPLVKDHSFFFFSYEGFRLRLPQTSLTTVPDQAARQNAAAGMKPYLDAYPFDPGQPDLGNGIAQFNATHSDPASLDAYSLRIDHRLGERFGVFGRYNYSPSEITSRGGSAEALSVLTPTRISIQTLTVGSVWGVTSAIVNDLRFNYSRTNSSSRSVLDDFGGAIPLASLNLPTPFTSADSFLAVGLFALKGSSLVAGTAQQSLQRQFNGVEGISVQKGRHALKFGADYRRLTPIDRPPLYSQAPFFLDMPSAENGAPLLSRVSSNAAANLLFRNLGMYAQDTWQTSLGATLTFGLRWDVDFAPSTLSGSTLLAVTGYDLQDLSRLSLASAGTPPFRTRFGNLAPRFGIAYEFPQNTKFQTVVRAGVGVFYDLATSEIGNLVRSGSYPFSALKVIPGGTFPLDETSAEPPVISAQSLQFCCGTLAAPDPNLELPYTLEWSLALEQGLANQSVTATYVGSSGRRLLQTAYVFAPNSSFYAAQLVGNTATSDYHALQLQWQHHLSHGLQTIASYTWSHSIDDGSAGSAFVGSNTLVPSLGASLNRASSDFDQRHSFSAGMTYEIPVPFSSAGARALLGGWSTDSFVVFSSAPPVDVSYGAFQDGALFNSLTSVRPDYVAGTPLYLSRSGCLEVLGPPCAGAKGFNPAAFVSPPLDATTGNPIRQGDLGRNALRGFGLAQWDFGVHRRFPIRDRVSLEFRAEIFNVLNHPNFAQPVGDLGSPQLLNPQFGQSQAMLAQGLGGSQYGANAGSGSLSSLYQIGGPRSVQFALKIGF